MIQAVNECDTYHTPCKQDKCMADQWSPQIDDYPADSCAIRPTAFLFIKSFFGPRSILRATGTLYCGPRMTLPMGFKARVDSLPVLFCYNPQSHLELPGQGIEPG